MNRFLLVISLFLIFSCDDKIKRTASNKPQKIKLKLIENITTQKILSQAWSQTNLLLSTDFAGNVEVRDVDSLKLKRTVSYEKGRIVDLVLALADETVLFVDSRGRLSGFNLKNGIFLNIGKNLRGLSALSSHPSSNKIVVGTRKGELFLLNDKLKKVKTKQTGLKQIKSLHFSPSGKYLAVVGFKKDLLILKTANWSLFKRIRTRGSVTSVAFSQDETYFALGTIFWQVDVYRLKKRKEIISKEVDLEPVTALAFSEDNQRLYVGYGRSGYGVISVFFGTNFSKTTTFPTKNSGIIFLLNRHKKIIAVTADGNFKQYK